MLARGLICRKRLPGLPKVILATALVSLLALLCSAVSPSNLDAQQTGAPSVSAYPDTEGGLEHFVRDLLKAHKQATRGDEIQKLVQSLALPDAPAWFSMVFGENASEPLARAYSRDRDVLLQQVDEGVVFSARDGFGEVRARKFEKSCDDLSGELTFPLLMARFTPVPLYELRMTGPTSVRRISTFAYVDGGFRYVGPLNISDEFAPAKNVTHPPRIRATGNVQAAKNIKKVAPDYPEAARREHLEGTVRFHAIIATDGSVQQVRVVRGYCSLAEASLPVVKQWRYSPTLVGGEPVEVDTTIDVIFNLRRH